MRALLSATLPGRHLRVLILVALEIEIAQSTIPAMLSMEPFVVDNVVDDLIGFNVLARSPDALLTVRPTSEWSRDVIARGGE